MSSPSSVLANWTALCGSDADTVISDLVPLLQLIGNTYISYRMLSPADQLPIRQVDQTKLLFVKELCSEINTMIEKSLSAVRYVPPDQL